MIAMEAPKVAHQFDIPSALHFEDANGLVHVSVSTQAADAEICVQGAHVTHWTPHGQCPVLFLSRKSLFTPGKAIRGGVPIIFPWFGPRSDGKPGPAHGFARTMDWVIEGTNPR
jgi:glucose-6-phosphate 1-epimerase